MRSNKRPFHHILRVVCGAIFALVVSSVCSATSPEDCQSLLSQLTERLQLKPDKQISADSFPALLRLLEKFPSDANAPFAGQIIVATSQVLTVATIHEIEKQIESYGFKSVSELSYMYTKPVSDLDAFVTQVFAVSGTRLDLENFLKSNFDFFVNRGFRLSLDPFNLPGLDEQFFPIVIKMSLDPNLAAQLFQFGLPKESLNNEALSTEKIPTVKSFNDPQLGSFREFTRRFAKFASNGMATKIFIFLGDFLRADRTESFRQKIDEIGFRSTSAAMAVNNKSPKALSQFVLALRELAESYLEDHPERTDIKPERIHLKGEVTRLLDAMKIPPKIKNIDQEPRLHDESTVTNEQPLARQEEDAENVSANHNMVNLSFIEQRPELLREDLIYLTKNDQIMFASSSIKSLREHHAHFIPKFVKALLKGEAKHRGDDGIAVMPEIAGSKGQLFEVRIPGRGRFRLIGCKQGTLYNILRFDMDAPDTPSAWRHKYGALCK